ncbi:MAG TPA: 3-oxoacyl-[acyl-carrier-protein] synthase III C-terminal domain-containing protein [Mycobacteriales bacterium]|nr:3-oxoacyl-[acyl-carrier-protein] synthase III C-terminal domain-containing protein [Mycobacteriales bacterium]
MTALVAVSAYLPAQRVSIVDLSARLQLTSTQVKVFQRFHGLSEVCRDEGTVHDLLTRTIRTLTALRGNEHLVKYVLHARGMPAVVPYPMNPLHDVCRQVGLGHAQAFTVTHHACATSLLAIDIAGRLLAADGDPDAMALVLAGEKTFTRDAELVPETSLFGEGAGACLVRAGGDRDRLLAYVTHLRGDFDGRLVEDAELLGRFQREYPEALAAVIEAAADRAGLRLDDLALILPHNVNAVSWRRLSKRIGFPLDRVLLDNVPLTGHCFAADAFINYQTAAERGLLQPGDRYLIAAAGLGATFSAMVLQH